MKEVKYLGHLITSEGVRPDPEKISDILDMPDPQDKAGVQRLLGSLTYLGKFIPNLASLTDPIRQLLNKKSRFEWTHEQKEAMKKIKTCLTSSPLLAFYDVNEPVTITCDASGTGLGACLLQNDQPVAYASRSLTESERSYAQIEKEMLAIVYACERFNQYIFGKKVECQTDHQPLVTILTRPFHANPVRMQRFLIRLQRYDLNVYYVKGKDLVLADMLSRAHVDHKPTDDQQELEHDCDILISSVVSNVNCSVGMMEKLKQATADDQTLSATRQYIENGWPTEQNRCNKFAKVYWADRANLATRDGLILYEDRLVIPKSLQPELLQRIHEGHQGQERCKSLARQSVYWRGMGNDIMRMVSECSECLLRRKAPAREPLIPHDIPDKPWQKLACDIFQYGGRKYQLVVDYHSKWVEVKYFGNEPTSRSVVNHIREVCARFGWPFEICSDGGPTYTAREFQEMCRKMDIKHTLSSAHNPRSNGQVERKIQFIKDLIAKCGAEGFTEALLQYRATPLGPGLGSPAELVMNRTLRTRIPSIEDAGYLRAPMENRTDERHYHERVLENQNIIKSYHDKVCKESNKSYRPGDFVRYRDGPGEQWSKEGQVVSQVNSRSLDRMS